MTNQSSKTRIIEAHADVLSRYSMKSKETRINETWLQLIPSMSQVKAELEREIIDAKKDSFE